MDLFAIKQALISKLSSDSQFSFLNTRIILRTGVDLSCVQTPGSSSPRAQLVLTTLKELGYDLHPEDRR